MTAVRLESLEHSYGSAFRLGPLDLEWEQGTRAVLAGPSGCGKTTLLRIVAGLERPAAGKVWLGERLASDPAVRIPAQERGVSMVFQTLALWPHMSAEKQVRFADPDRSRARARELLARLGLAGKERRRPGELSGGEAQRLALARALASRPSLLLLDEPLRSVDPLLRDEILGLIRDLSRQEGLTTVLVTHDRREALAFGERIALLRDGRLVEEGRPDELVKRPRTAFCARFLMDAVCWPVELDGGVARLPFGEMPVEKGPSLAGGTFAALGPHHLAVAPTGGGGVHGEVAALEPFGEGYLLHVKLDGRELKVQHHEPLAPQSPVRLSLRGTPPLVHGEP